MHIVNGIFRSAERLVLRDVEEHLRRRLGVLCEHELDLETSEVHGLAVFCDHVGGYDERRRAGRRCQSKASCHHAFWPSGDEGTILVGHATRLQVAAKDILVDRGLGKSFGRDHLDLAAFYVLFRHDTCNTAEMVDMTVGDDDSDDGLFRSMLEVQFLRGRGRLVIHERIHNDDPVRPFDEGDICEVCAANLIDVLGDFE